MGHDRIREEAVEVAPAAALAGDPLGKGGALREDWTAGLKVNRAYEGAPVEVLFWAGCMGALYDERSRNTVIAAARVLEKAGVNFAILGKEESCSGDPAPPATI